MMQIFHRKDRIHAKKIIAAVFSLLLLGCLFTGYQNALANAGVQPLVETRWLSDNLKNPEIRIVHVGQPKPDSQKYFNMKHIPGSVYLGFADIMGVLGNGSMPPDKAKFEALMSRLGINNNTKVVITGSGTNPFTTTAFWLMKYFGHENVSYVNGGIMKWIRERRQTTGAPTNVKPTKYNATPDQSIFAAADYVLKNIKNSKAVLLDVRSVDEYKGNIKDKNNQDKRKGHIPGAINMEFYSTNLNNDGTFKPAKALKAAYEGKGITKDKEVIVYCLGGVRATHTYFVLKHLLGYPKVRNYVGSWGEWANRLDPAKYPAEK